jgi:hypothetical protein
MKYQKKNLQFIIACTEFIENLKQETRCNKNETMDISNDNYFN